MKFMWLSELENKAIPAIGITSALLMFKAAVLQKTQIGVVVNLIT